MIVAEAPLGRHLTGHRSTPGGRSFAKASRGPDDHRELLREAAVYEVVRDRCPDTAAHLPRDVRWDADAGELEMEAVPAGDLASQVAGDGMLEPAVAAEVGRVVGGLHAEAGRLGDDDAPASVWLRDGFGVDRPTPAYLRLLSGGRLACGSLTGSWAAPGNRRGTLGASRRRASARGSPRSPPSPTSRRAG